MKQFSGQSADLRLIPIGSSQNGDGVTLLKRSVSAPTAKTFTGNRNLLPQQSFELDGMQVKKLQLILDHTHEINQKSYGDRNADSDSKMLMKVKAIEAAREKEFIARRHKVQEPLVSFGNKCASAGDDVVLRNMLTSGELTVTAKDPVSGRTILIAAVIAFQGHIVRMLIKDFKANVDDTSLLGQSSPLHFAVLGGDRQITLFLLTSGANVNFKNRQGCTPLHFVTNLGIAKLLGKFGADPLIRCKEVSHHRMS